MLTKLQTKVVHMMADCNLNVTAVARVTNYHPNTIMYHLNRIQEVTGQNPRTFYGVVELLRQIDQEGGESHDSKGT